MKTPVALLLAFVFISSCHCESVVSTMTNAPTSVKESVNLMPTPTSRLMGSTTTVVPVETSLPLMEQQKLSIVGANLSIQFISGTVDCACDLLVGLCDLSCCCDQDCVSSELRTFLCTTTLTGEGCLEFDNLLWTSITQCSCPDQSLLCIIREQDPSGLEYQKHPPIINLKQFRSELLLHSVPGDSLPSQSPSTTALASFYRIGDPVLTFQNDTSLGFLLIPGHLYGLQCHDSNPITYLKDEERHCERQLTPLSVVCASLSAVDISNAISIAKIPNTSITGLQSNESTFTKTSVLCSSLSGQLTSCQVSLPVYNNSTCTNVLLEAKYSIIHDGTGQIMGVYIDIVLGSVYANQESYIQKYTIRFQNQDQAVLRPILQRSGNPGYVVGQPVLAGSLSDTNIIDVAIQSSAWLSVRQSSRQCNANSPTTVVQFREDLATTCVHQVSLADILEDCDGFKMRAFEILTPSPQVNYIGMFGDSNPLNVSQWIQLINDTSPEGFADQSAKVGALCSGVPTILQISILYSYFGDFINPLSMISGVRFSYYTNNIYKKQSESNTIMISLKTSVTFIDISVPPVEVLQTVSDTVRKLPQDFLYPLFSGDQVANLSVTTMLTLIFILLL